MRYGVASILILLFAGCIKPASAQQLIFKNYTVNDGLIANAIRRVFQDSKGFLWIATWEGFSTYDGHTFTNYSTANGLSHNLVNDFYESPDGELYVATNGGGFDIIKENRIIQKAAPAAITVNSFVHFPNEKIIATTDNEGLQEFTTGKLTRLRKNRLLSSYFDLTVLSDSFLIAAGERGIQLLYRNYELISEVRNTEAIYAQFKIYQDSKKRILVGTPSGLKILANIPKKGEPLIFVSPAAPFNIPELGQNKINAVFEDADGTLWIGTEKGLFKINPDASWQLITKKNGLASDNITTIFQDNEKNIWFGTLLGLSKLVTKTTIQVYTTENGLGSNDLSFLYPVGNQQLLISTGKDAQLFNIRDGKFKPVTNSIDPPLYSVVANSNPPLVIGTNKMVTFDSASLQFKEPVQFQAPFKSSPYCIVIDKQGNFFLSDEHQLYFAAGKEAQSVKILEDFFSVLLVDKKGYLWAATLQKGLYHIQYSFANNKLTILASEHFMPGENIRSLFEDSKGNIWVGTRYHGVYRFSKNGTATYNILHIDQNKGLSSNWIKGLAETKEGELWVASLQGLDKLIQQNSFYRVFNFSRVNNFYGTVTNMITGKDHSLWLATKEGLVHITDGQMEKLPPLPVYITKVSSPDSVYLLQAKLNLDHGHNQLQFEFSSPGFINEKQLFYSYRLWGSANDGWTEASNQHTVSYASLQPGNYRFEVRTMGWNGNWGKAAGFDFKIKPPFWQMWWFLALCSLLFLTGIYWSVRRRVGTIRSKAAMKHKVTETEMMALRAQMNPHFIFNCINSIDALIHSNDKYNATIYLNKFAKLLRGILDSSKENIVSFTKDIEALKLYVELEELRHENKFRSVITVDPELLNSDYKVPPLIVQPFVENAILHGLKNKDANDGLLTIDIKKVNDKIQYTITDNGIGREAAEKIRQNKESHYGLQMSYDRIKLFNKEPAASVQVTDLPAAGGHAGTEVKVLLNII
ncbi:MAG: two-component regulator propeller domain-containing protein [Bacteroidota bacterium]